MATWAQFAEKDYSLRYLENLDRQATNQKTDLEVALFGAYRYWLAQQMIEQLTPIQAEIMGEIHLVNQELAKHDPEHPSPNFEDRDLVKGATERLKLLQRAQIEVDYTLKVLIALPSYECPQWFFEWAKTVLNDPKPEIVDPLYLGQSPVRKSRLPWKNKKGK